MGHPQFGRGLACLMQRDRFVGFGGGLPVKHEGVLVGAIGVSGGSEAQDVQFAEAALAGLVGGG